jgi:hypothetical protein
MEKSAREILKEEFIEKRVKKFLEKKGFKDKAGKKELWEHGVDIKMKHKDCGWYYLVECKGDPKQTVKCPSGSRSSSLNSALGQIITRMHTHRKSPYGGYNYGVAFPKSFEKSALNKIPYYVCNKLRLSIFIVNKKGIVEQYNHKRLKKVQKVD